MHSPPSRATSKAALLLSGLVLVAATSSPHVSRPTPLPRVPYIHPPTVALHTEFVVEVNRFGQVVRVKSAKGCKNPTFNAQTYGNVLQMWIRHPDGTADVGLYRVTYDYNPRTRKVLRRVALVRLGGTWGNVEGAANEMLDTARREDETASGKHLPPLRQIIGATPTPPHSQP
jgi:hypothetical protein